MRAHLAEFLGAFTLVFAGCGAIAVGSLSASGVALVFGLVVAALIYGLGPISGAHFNPAVSIGFAIGGHVPWTKAATYAIVQIAGAVAGSALLRLTLGDVPLGVTRPAVAIEPALAWEIVFTALLMLVITAVATDTRVVGQAAALAIGGTVTLGSLVAGPISGASLNPARSIGPAVVSGDLADLWIYLVGPVAGAVIGARLYRYLRGARVTA